METAIAAVVGVVVGAVLAWLFLRGRSSAREAAAVARARELEDARAAEEAPPEKPISEHVLSSRGGEPLAKMLVYKDRAVIEPLVKLHVTTPPFRQFLVNRILQEMKNDDEERAREGLLDPDQVLDYEVETDGDLLKRIVIKNYRDEKRLDELRGAIRWTLARMYEKEYR